MNQWSKFNRIISIIIICLGFIRIFLDDLIAGALFVIIGICLWILAICLNIEELKKS